MNEQELREMVRESIARHRSGGDATAGPTPARTGAATYQTASFARFPLLRGGDDDGMCLIEPAVRCNHCGYCQSFGH
jgi:hypothetical protein